MYFYRLNQASRSWEPRSKIMLQNAIKKKDKVED
jgi:hypothetical protein